MSLVEVCCGISLAGLAAAQAPAPLAVGRLLAAAAPVRQARPPGPVVERRRDAARAARGSRRQGLSHGGGGARVHGSARRNDEPRLAAGRCCRGHPARLQRLLVGLGQFRRAHAAHVADRRPAERQDSRAHGGGEAARRGHAAAVRRRSRDARPVDTLHLLRDRGPADAARQLQQPLPARADRRPRADRQRDGARDADHPARRAAVSAGRDPPMARQLARALGTATRWSSRRGTGAPIRRSAARARTCG